MVEMVQVQIRGLVRFSYLSENGFSKSSVGLEATREMLYQPDRLSRRFELFEKLALHSLVLQKDLNFRTAVLVGDDFPADALARLQDMLDGFVSAQIIQLPPMRHIYAVKAAYAALPDDPGATHTATFRLDDDDAMHRRTVERMRELSEGLIGARGGKAPFGIAFNRGFYLDLDNTEKPLTERYENTPLGVGMAVVAPLGANENAFRRNHRKLAQYFDVYTEVKRPMFIRTVHQDNDSAATPTGREGTLSQKRIKGVLRRGFGMTLDDLKAL